MTGERFLLDTFFIQALISQRDSFHQQALAFSPRLRAAAAVWVTEAVLVEVGNALSTSNRLEVARFITQCYMTRNMHVVSVDTDLLGEAVQLYQARLDKDWGLTDCISFVVMRQQGLTDAVTRDRHFIQAGYRILL